eukprot:4869115-Amphidinium_carterae.1
MPPRPTRQVVVTKEMIAAQQYGRIKTVKLKPENFDCTEDEITMLLMQETIYNMYFKKVYDNLERVELRIHSDSREAARRIGFGKRMENRSTLEGADEVVATEARGQDGS